MRIDYEQRGRCFFHRSPIKHDMAMPTILAGLNETIGMLGRMQRVDGPHPRCTRQKKGRNPFRLQPY
jgi:hypothetical protein